MPGKWDKLKDKVPEFKLDATYQQRVDEAKGQYIGLDPAELGRQFKYFDDAKDGYEAKVKECNLELEALSQLIVEILRTSGLYSIELESGMKVGLDEKIYIGILQTPEAAAAYEKWQNSPKIKPLKKLYAQTRDGFVREEVLKAMVAGKPVPKQFTAWVDLKFKRRAKLTGKKKENSNEGDE